MKKTFVAIVSGLLICATLSSEASAWAGPMAKAAALVGDAATATAEQFCALYQCERFSRDCRITICVP